MFPGGSLYLEWIGGVGYWAGARGGDWAAVGDGIPK